ncbi:MAG: pilus assembly protein PilY [Ectothiorhodospiraceae bacterium]|nr:pilus assembly protein PilY [Ectothiorhodospiraceae bacterium]
MTGRFMRVRRAARGTFLGAVFGLSAAMPATAQAGVDIANAPLFLTTSIEPNIVFILDDSGSMHWEIMPDAHINSRAYYLYGRVDNLYSSGNYTDRAPTTREDPYNAFSRSPQFNSIYYNPAVTYLPWPKADNNEERMPDADPEAAYHNPMRTDRGTRDLTSVNSRNGSWRSCDTITRDADTGDFSFSSCSSNTRTENFWPALYYWHDGSDGYAYDNYQRVDIEPATTTYSGHGRENRSDCTGGVCTYDEEIQNFANWYTYYRSRVLAARGGIGSAFAQQAEGMRVGYGTINAGTTDVDGVSTNRLVRGVRRFTGEDREEFFDLLYDRDIPASGTPLRTALQAAGEYYSRTDSSGPWSTTPGFAGGEDYACRQSFTILMSDGFWNGADPGVGNVDGNRGPVHSSPDGLTTYRYEPGPPFEDSYSNTLADVAMHYWKNDLRSDLDNLVPTSQRNPAFWQHMVTYTVGLGVQGRIDPDEAFDAIASGATIDWPDPTDGDPEKIDDMLHAAVNSRGGFFSASDPELFSEELGGVLDDIIARVEESATSSAASAAILQTDTLLYVAGFRSGDWSGELKAYELDTDGSVGRQHWNAETRLLDISPSARRIYTTNSDTGSGVPLRPGDIALVQRNALSTDLDGDDDGGAADRIDWLRGVSVEGFRSRTEAGYRRLLGDIVNSSPQYVGKRDFGYNLIGGTEGSRYLEFRRQSSYRNRPDVIYVGSNNGLFHAFDAENGNELFAYMPSELLLPESAGGPARINRLMDVEYTHRYFVDGTAVVGDAYLGGNWKTVAVGSMGAGGRTVFALDVTNPGSFGSGNVLWEFTHPDLGYAVGQPSIVRMRDGSWAAVFGNGYNSNSHRAGLFIVPLDDPDDYVFIDTGVGDASSPNGLASPQITDWPGGDLSARRIYAGDLQGNLWAFNVSSTNSNHWDNAGNRRVLFQAQDDNDQPQPITSRPALAVHPDEAESLIVLFGTGSYFRNQDRELDNPQIQSLYGIVDRGSAVGGRDELLEQTIEWQGQHTFDTEDGSVTYTLRQVSDNELDTEDGWFLDLVVGGNAEGERVINAPVFPTGAMPTRVRFSTLIPDEDPCGTGRRGFIMDLDLATGGRTSEAVFDLNLDGTAGPGDNVGGVPISGVESGQGEELTIIRSHEGSLDHLYDGRGRDIRSLNEAGPAGRQSWMQLR